ncbi:diguanylate cyclase [Desulfovibrio inopinatus]|uniref:diguanylate cyclase n=1 Tax=Desulfovibrio inopinatus TaxID=102109 RepID=UPI00040BBE16|nr:diguanylate cyclase [Desulfovibrio inopinatus]
MTDPHISRVLDIDSSRRFVLKYLGLIALLVSIVIASLFFAFNINASKTYLQQLHEYGKTFFDEIVVTRSWVAKHGGVYVPLDTTDGINPYLQRIEGIQAVMTCNNRDYTLKNPALVTRELSESPSHRERLQYKITSLKTLNPSNAPDTFEIESLHAFEQGQTEHTKFDILDGKLYYRYMAPLMTDDTCLKCHAQQGYKRGDIRGGIAVSILAEDFNKKISESRFYMVVSGIGVVALVIFSIMYISRHFIRDLQKAQTVLTNVALTDFLTGLYNRFTGIRLLSQEIARCQRSHDALSIALFDLDHFKKVNDTYGHNVGDEVLVALASLLKKSVRTYDIGCRYGGEEFLFIMPQTSLEHASMITNRLLEELTSAPVITSAGPLSISFSAGIAQYMPDERLEEFIARADTLLYEAKAKNRNQVCS